MEILKKCSCCGELKLLDMFSIHKACKYGVNNKCKKCVSKYHKQHYQEHKAEKKEYSKKHKKRIIEYQKQWRQEHKEEIIEYQKQWCKEHKEYIKEKAKIYQKEKKQYLNKQRIKYKKNRKEKDKLFKLKFNISSLVRGSIKRNGYQKKSKTTDILGCSIEEFKQYLEQQFKSWMNWDNYGKYNGEYGYGWDIDHIIPVSSAKTEEDILKLNNYTNLQPLDSYINRHIKKDKI